MRFQEERMMTLWMTHIHMIKTSRQKWYECNEMICWPEIITSQCLPLIEATARVILNQESHSSCEIINQCIHFIFRLAHQFTINMIKWTVTYKNATTIGPFKGWYCGTHRNTMIFWAGWKQAIALDVPIQTIVHGWAFLLTSRSKENA